MQPETSAKASSVIGSLPAILSPVNCTLQQAVEANRCWNSECLAYLCRSLALFKQNTRGGRSRRGAARKIDDRTTYDTTRCAGSHKRRLLTCTPSHWRSSSSVESVKWKWRHEEIVKCLQYFVRERNSKKTLLNYSYMKRWFVNWFRSNDWSGTPGDGIEWVDTLIERSVDRVASN